MLSIPKHIYPFMDYLIQRTFPQDVNLLHGSFQGHTSSQQI